MAEYNKGKKISKTFRLSGDVAAFLQTRPDATKFLEGVVRREKAKERSVFVVDLGPFNTSSRQKILDFLQKEGVSVQEVTSRISSGFVVD